MLDTITTVAAKLGGMGRPLPDALLTLEYQLRLMALSLSPPIISTDRFTQLAEKCGVKRVNVANTLQVLSELGVIVFVKGMFFTRYVLFRFKLCHVYIVRLSNIAPLYNNDNYVYAL